MWKIPMTRSVKLLRENAIEVITTAIENAFEIGVSAHETFVHLDEIIDAYEMVGLFEEYELRMTIIRKLEERINERKKENH